MIDKFFTLDDLINTGFKMVQAYSSSGVEIGEYYLQPKVVNMWDWSDYSKHYSYYSNDIKFLVNVCKKDSENRVSTYLLLKDLSNLPDRLNEEEK